MIPTTKRLPGKITVSEVMEFQRRYGLKMDGKFGRQCMGQVLEIEAAYDEMRQAYMDLTTAPVEKTSLDWWSVVLGAVSATALGVMGLWHSILSIFQ